MFSGFAGLIVPVAVFVDLLISGVAAAHPEMQPLYGGEVGPGAWGISLGTWIKPLAQVTSFGPSRRARYFHARA